jgi:hypothetical protein
MVAKMALLLEQYHLILPEEIENLNNFINLLTKKIFRLFVELPDKFYK